MPKRSKLTKADIEDMLLSVVEEYNAYTGYEDEVRNVRTSDYISAVKELSKMNGFDQPSEKEDSKEIVLTLKRS